MHHFLIVTGLALGLASPASAQQETTAWVEQKCQIYAQAWAQALDLFGSGEMNYAFMAGNENFIASGCAERGRICPQSEQELDVANAMTLALMNAGAASTFLPFKCAPDDAVEGGWTGPGL